MVHLRSNFLHVGKPLSNTHIFIQPGADITRFGTSSYCWQHYSNWGRTWICLWTHKRHPNTGELLGIHCEHFWENKWTCYDGAALILLYIICGALPNGLFMMFTDCSLSAASIIQQSTSPSGERMGTNLCADDANNCNLLLMSLLRITSLDFVSLRPFLYTYSTANVLPCSRGLVYTATDEFFSVGQGQASFIDLDRKVFKIVQVLNE